jgi:DNA helicase-2/ATP-dependent DNA helicase PcrA
LLEVQLEQNYRSTGAILAAANVLSDVIARHMAPAEPELRALFAPRRLWTEADAGPPVTIAECEDTDGEVAWILRTVRSLEREAGRTPPPGGGVEGLQLHRYAVVVRTNRQIVPFELELGRQRMPYVLGAGQGTFWKRAEVRLVTAWLTVLHGLDRHPDQLGRVLEAPPFGLRAAAAQVKSGGELDTTALGSTDAGRCFLEAVRELHRLAHPTGGALDVPELIDQILERTGYRAWLLEHDEEGARRLESVRTLQQFLVAETNLASALLGLQLIKAEGDVLGRPNALGLYTVHACKGLEFDVVFLAGFEAGLIPHAGRDELDAGGFTDPDAATSAIDPQAHARVREELSLAYVGLTRARQRLYLSYAERRERPGGRAPRRSLPSPLLWPLRERMPRGLLEAA